MSRIRNPYTRVTTIGQTPRPRSTLSWRGQQYNMVMLIGKLMAWRDTGPGLMVRSYSMRGVVVLRDAYNIRISRRRPPTRDRGPSLYGSVCGVSGLEDSTTTAAHGHAHHPSVTLTPPAPRRIVACPTCEARTSPQRDTHPTRTQAHCRLSHMRARPHASEPCASQVSPMRAKSTTLSYTVFSRAVLP